MNSENLIIALLIDTDNVSPKYMDYIEKELIALGKVSYKRMYGDFAQNSASSWRSIVNDFSITPIQQYSYTTGKNATDSKMVIDAMDILYSGNVNAMCIMSSDSDFTGLVKRLKESNIYVIGAGEGKTPASFVKACDRFLTLDNEKEEQLKEEIVEIKENKEDTQIVKKEPKKEVDKKKEPTKANSKKAKEEEVKIVTKEEIEGFVKGILEGSAKPLQVSVVMEKIYQRYPQFDYRKYGAKKAPDFFNKELFNIVCPKTNLYEVSLK